MAYAYSFNDVTATLVNGVLGTSMILGSGAGISEEGIEVDFNKDKVTLVTGADGTPQHSMHSANDGTVTIRVLKTSPTNYQLNQLYNAEIAQSSNIGSDTITVSNLQTGDNIVCQSCSFRRHPRNLNAVDGGMNEWVFNAGIVVMHLGNGNPAS